MGGELQVENYSGWLQKKNGGGLPRKTIVVSFIWRTTAISYRPRAAVVGFKWSTLVAVRRTKVASFRRRTTAMGYRWRTTVVGFKKRTLVKQLKWLEKSCRLNTENDSGAHQMENNSGWVQMDNCSGGQ